MAKRKPRKPRISLLQLVVRKVQQAAVLEGAVRELQVRVQVLEQRLAAGAAATLPQASAAGPLVMCEDLQKYRKMKAVGIPSPAVRQSMMKDGVDPGRLFPNAALERAARPLALAVPKLAAQPAAARQQPAQAQMRITVDAIENIRQGLRKTPARKQTKSSPRTPVETRRVALRGLSNVTPSPSGAKPSCNTRSPPAQGTSARRSAARVAATPYVDQTEFLKRALLQKFKGSQCVPATPEADDDFE